MHDPVRGYDGTEDLGALRDFVTASGISDKDLALEVYIKMLELNRVIRNADVKGLSVRINRGHHIWMSSHVLSVSITRDEKDVEFLND